MSESLCVYSLPINLVFLLNRRDGETMCRGGRKSYRSYEGDNRIRS